MTRGAGFRACRKRRQARRPAPRLSQGPLMLTCAAILVAVGVVLALRVRYAGSLEVNPRYRDLLARQGLTTVADFLALPAVIFCGHRGRHVGRVVLGDGD